MEYKIISTDSHINEPGTTYVDRVPKHLRDQAPRIMPGTDGGDGWSFDGNIPTVTFGLGATGAVTEQDFKKYRPSGIKWEELRPGNYDGAAAIKDNEMDGVDAAALYPAAILGAYPLPDREMAVACVRAYNDWLIDDFAAVDPDRLFALAFMPTNDGIDTAVAEAKRVVAKGARALFLPLPDIPYHDPYYDPLWQVATEANVPVTIHRSGVSTKENRGPTAVTGTSALGQSMPGLNVVGVVQRFYSAINPISNLIFTGLFERFPSLVFIAAEVNCNWIPGLAELMDDEYDRQHHWAQLPFESRPSSYFGKNIFVTMLDDYVGCGMAKDDPALARTTMFSTDYPHSVTLWPRSQEYIAKMTAGMDEGTTKGILAGNAVRAYGLGAS